MDDRLYYVIFVLLLIVMAIVIPFFLKAEQPNPCKKSLVLNRPVQPFSLQTHLSPVLSETLRDMRH